MKELILKDMKTLRKAFIALLALLCFMGCEDEELNHTNVTAVTSLYSPDDNAHIVLKDVSAVTFQWEPATAEDNGVVFYEVVFDNEGGDFSEPIFDVPSDGNGLQRSLELSSSDLSRIAEISGVERGQSGKISWSVISSKGINPQSIMTSRVIEVERSPGFNPPAQAFIAGSATEVGEDVSQALEMTSTGNGTFEIYTSLQPGEYYITSAQSGDGETYYIDNDGRLQSDGQTTVSEEGVYRIRIGFSDATTTIDEIGAVSLWFPPRGEFMFDLPYSGEGTWTATDEPIEFKQESWGRDERYKFRFNVIKQDGTETEEWFGSVNNDNSRPDANTPESFWYMVPVTDDYWANSFKFMEAVDNQNADVEIIFNSTVTEYTHVITPK